MHNPRPHLFTMLFTLVSYIPVNGSRLALPLYALHLDAPAWAVGLVSALLWVFPLIASLPLGRLADRYGTRWLLVGGSLCGVLGMLLPGLSPTLAALLASATLAGLWNAVLHILTLNLMGELARPDRRAQSFVWYSMIGSVTNFSGPLIAGFSIEHAGYPGAFLIMALPPLVVSAMLLVWGGMLPGGKPVRAARVRFRLLFEDRALLRLLLIGGLVQLGIDAFPFLVPLHGHDIGLAPSVIGAIVSTVYVSSFIVQSAIPRLVARHGDERVLAVAFVSLAICFALTPFAGSAMALGAVAFLFGLSMGSGQPITTNMMFSRYARDNPGEMLGLRLTFNNLIRVAAPAVMGSIASVLGLAAVCGLVVMAMMSGSTITRAKPTD